MGKSQALFDLDTVFAEDDYLYFYSEFLTEERTDAEVQALVNLLGLDRSLDIMDLACGYGRHSNRLAGLGHRVTGIERMPGFLEIARNDAARRGVRVIYLQKDIREIEFEQSFDLVLLLYTAFGYFDDQGNLELLIRIRRALRPGGRLCFDVPNRDTFLSNFTPCHVSEKEGNMMIDRLSFDTLTGISHNQRIIIRNGVRRDKDISIRIYNPTEIQALLREAGFESVSIFGSFDGQVISSEALRLFIVAYKPVATHG